MPNTIVIGGSAAGLASAFALAKLGRDVTILERDPQSAPSSVEAANTSWPRPTVPQSTQSQTIASLGVGLLASRAPEIHSALLNAGALDIDLTAGQPPGSDDPAARRGDKELRVLGVRRRTFDSIVRRELLQRPGVTIRSGVTVRAVEASSRNGQRVTGVRTADGELLKSDLVIDASGRKSAASGWLSDAGFAAPVKTVEPCSMRAYTRFYRRLSPAPPGPVNIGYGVRVLTDYCIAFLFLSDNETISLTIGSLPDDRPLRALRHDAAFTAAVQAIPLLAPWISREAAEPISPVYAMAGLENSFRLPARDRPLPVGFYAVGDSACTTDPVFGRGISLALAHAHKTAEAVSAHPDPDEMQARAVTEAGRELLAPWYADSVRSDRERTTRWRATVHGTPAPATASGALTYGEVAMAAETDAMVWHRFWRVAMTLDPPAAVYADDEVRCRVAQARGERAAPPPLGPARDEFVGAVARAVD